MAAAIALGAYIEEGPRRKKIRTDAFNAFIDVNAVKSFLPAVGLDTYKKKTVAKTWRTAFSRDKIKELYDSPDAIDFFTDERTAVRTAIRGLKNWDGEEKCDLHDPNVVPPKTLLEFGSLGSLYKNYKAIVIEWWRVMHEHDSLNKHFDNYGSETTYRCFDCEEVAMDGRWGGVRRLKEAPCYETELRTIMKERMEPDEW